MLFVSPTFLYPVDTGGRIRTTQILRGLSSGAFDVVLGLPATAAERQAYWPEIEKLAKRCFSWPVSERDALFSLLRMRHLPGELPIPVRTDWSEQAERLVAEEIAREPDITVFDFPHAMVLAPERMPSRSVLFTHNVEAEIFARHASVARDPLRRWIWSNQHRKMRDYEARVISRVDLVIGVSQRDCDYLAEHYGARRTVVIPTGTDVDFFEHAPPAADKQVVFCGSMDWMANIEGVEWFRDAVWPAVLANEPSARMKVVGRSPPSQLVRSVELERFNWEFTGWVDDVRPHVQGARAFVIPLRVAGGTRLKVFEAMAMGAPVVSTGIGVEGLPLEPGRHFLQGDTAEELAQQIVRTLREPELCARLSSAGRAYVEEHASFQFAAKVFENACLSVLPERAGTSETRV